MGFSVYQSGLFVPRCLAVILAVCGLTAPAVAQQGAAGGDTTNEKPVYLQAKELIDDTENNRYIAKGDVEVHYKGRILRANTLYYYPDSKRIHAVGDVVVVEADGKVEFADEMELSDDLKSAVALAFFARLENNATIGAVTATHSADGSRNILTRAYYTACKACAGKNGKDAQKPTWRIRASKVVQDQKTRMINYKNAVIEVKGVPVFYAPVFSHPDPSSGRHSGLLFPQARFSGKYGFSYQQSYYKVLGPYGDATITPRIFTGVAPMLLGGLRRNFHAGPVNIQGSITDARDFDGKGKPFGNRRLRGHVFAQGRFNINNRWLWGFGSAWVSDDLFLRRYDISGETDTRGVFRTDSLRLNNQLYVQGKGNDFFVQGGAIRFQGLRAGDRDKRFPIVGPLLDIRRRFDDPLLGGTMMVRANTVALNRIDGADSVRGSLSLDWSRRLVSRNGVVVRPYAQGRGDFYQLRNTDFRADLGSASQSQARALGVIGADFRWPFVRPGRHVTWVVEPLAQIAASPNRTGNGKFVSGATGTLQSLIPNEDSIAVEFDGASLFSSNRFSGFDRWEGGLRANVGGRISGRWGKDGRVSLLAGQVFRTKTNTGFSAASGLRAKTSDYVSTFTFSPSRVLAVTTHTRFDKSSFNLRRIETDASLNLNKKQLGPAGKIFYNLRINSGYLNFDDVIASGRPTEEVRGGAVLGLTKNWFVSASGVRDLDAKRTRSTSLGLTYRDHCSSLQIAYVHNNVRDRSLTPSTSIVVRFTLLTLGTFGTR